MDFDDEVIAGRVSPGVGNRARGRQGGRGLGCRVAREKGRRTHGLLVIDLGVLVLGGFVGFAVISEVPDTLQTPLMSGTNAIRGIVILGGCC